MATVRHPNTFVALPITTPKKNLVNFVIPITQKMQKLEHTAIYVHHVQLII